MPATLSGMNLLLSRGRELEALLTAKRPVDALDDAVRQLMHAATEPAGVDVAAIQRFEPDPNRRQMDPSVDEALAVITFELHAGNVLIAAAQTIPDVATDRPGLTEPLHTALQAVDRTRQALEDEIAPETWARFEEKVAAVSGDVTPGDAAARFRESAVAALDGITKASEDLLAQTIEVLQKIDSAKVLAAIQQFGRASEGLSAAGRLYQLGVSKVRAAYDALVRLLGEGLLERARSKVEAIWQHVKEGQYTHTFLIAVYGTERIKEQIDTALSAPAVDLQAVIRACAAVAPLQRRFEKHMALLSGILSGITVSAAVLALTPMNVQAAPFVASAYLLVLGAVVIIGAEYTGVSWSLNWVKGVGVIVGEIAQPAPLA